MDTRPGTERTATPAGRSRTAVTVAALVILSAFADTATPASARATDSTMVANNVPPSEIVTTVPAPKTTVLTRIESGMANSYGPGLHRHLTTQRRGFLIYWPTAS